MSPLRYWWWQMMIGLHGLSRTWKQEIDGICAKARRWKGDTDLSPSLAAWRCTASEGPATCRPWFWPPTFSLSSSSSSSPSSPLSSWAVMWRRTKCSWPSPFTRRSASLLPSSYLLLYKILLRCAFPSIACRYVATLTWPPVLCCIHLVVLVLSELPWVQHDAWLLTEV